MGGKATTEDSRSFELRMKRISSHILAVDARVLEKRQEVQNKERSDNFLIIDVDIYPFPMCSQPESTDTRFKRLHFQSQTFSRASHTPDVHKRIDRS